MMTKNQRHHTKSQRLKRLLALGLSLWLLPFVGFGQQVTSSVDTTAIKIGQQITYKLQVQTAPASRVVFPKGQNFRPLEVFDSTAVDTFLRKDKQEVRLLKTYALTRFDSGAYTIPRQKVLIDGKAFYTDSIPVVVHGVVVDTTKQKLYPVKPALTIKTPMRIAHWVWWALGVLVVLLILIYVIRKARKKIIEKKKELPPYEKAIQSLEALDGNRELESGQVKAYYSSLSDAVKRYVDEKIDDRAMESTTAEFIALLRSYKKEKQVYLKEQVIDSLEAILRRADLAKFAGIKTDKLTAREDRKTVEDDINAFDQSIPEPTEEERMQNEEYRKAREHRRKRRRILLRTAVGVLVVLLAAGVFIGIKGLDYTKDLLSAQSTGRLLHQKEWISSTYGTFGINLTTPKVLIREMDSVPSLFPGNAEIEERFSYGSLRGNYYVEAVNVRFKTSSQIDSLHVGTLFDKTTTGDSLVNIIFKHNDFTTLQGKKGQKVYGTFKVKTGVEKTGQQKAYTFLLFNENGGLQELFIVYNAGDEAGKEITERIVNSVKFNKKKGFNTQSHG